MRWITPESTPTEFPRALDFEWGLDHGDWSVLWRMFPLLDIPVVQLSLDRTNFPSIS